MQINDKLEWLKKNMNTEGFNTVLQRCRDFIKQTDVKSVDIKTEDDFDYIWVLKGSGYRADRIGRIDLKGKKARYIFIYGK
ncbi:MAG: hypothetical protein ACYDDE_00775 [bacterium]